jgi:anti-anti-sigma factor
MPLNQISRDSRLSAPPSDFGCVSRAEGPGVNRVMLSGELDMATAPQLEEALSDAARGSVAVILDLSELEFMDSTGLQVIVRARALLEEVECRLVLVPGGRQVQLMFEITGVERHLEFATAHDAVRCG